MLETFRPHPEQSRAIFSQPLKKQCQQDGGRDSFLQLSCHLIATAIQTKHKNINFRGESFVALVLSYFDIMRSTTAAFDD